MTYPTEIYISLWNFLSNHFNWQVILKNHLEVSLPICKEFTDCYFYSHHKSKNWTNLNTTSFFYPSENWGHTTCCHCKNCRQVNSENRTAYLKQKSLKPLNGNLMNCWKLNVNLSVKYSWLPSPKRCHILGGLTSKNPTKFFQWRSEKNPLLFVQGKGESNYFEIYPWERWPFWNKLKVFLITNANLERDKTLPKPDPI